MQLLEKDTAAKPNCSQKKVVKEFFFLRPAISTSSTNLIDKK